MSTKKKAKRLLGTALVKVGLLDKAATGAPRRMTEAIPALKPEIDVPDAYDKVEKLLRAPAPLSSPRSAVLHLSLPLSLIHI